MATTNYSYHDYESLGDIANKFNTSVLNLVKLNKWLQDPNDGHTFMFPSNAPDYVRPHLDESGNVDYYEFVSSDDRTDDCMIYKLLEIVVPLIGNGNVSIEDYWDNVNKTTGVSYNILVDNIISDSNAVLYDNTNESGTPQVSGKIILPDQNIVNSNTLGQGNTITNAYIDDYLSRNGGVGKTIDSQFVGVDYFSGAIGNQLQSQINAGGKNLNLYKNSGLYRALGSTYLSQYDQVNIPGRFRGRGSTYLSQYDQVNIPGRFRGRGKIYQNERITYEQIGKPNRVQTEGQCIVTINGTTLYMPCYPEEVSDTTSVSYTSENTLGRSEPFQAYNNSGPRTISFTFKMHREMTGDTSEIERIVRCIESSVYPNYGSKVAAVRTTVQIGGTIFISGVVTSETTSWSGPIGKDSDGNCNYKYNMVTVTFTVTEVTGEPKSSSYVNAHGGFRDK